MVYFSGVGRFKYPIQSIHTIPKTILAVLVGVYVEVSAQYNFCHFYPNIIRIVFCQTSFQDNVNYCIICKVFQGHL